MTIPCLASPRPFAAVSLGLGIALFLGACTSDAPDSTASPTATASPATPRSTPTPTPSPTPEPTPRFTNEPDEDLAALIPTTAAGLDVVVAPFDEFALTPGDVGLAYGDLGLRFSSLVLAYVSQPRTTLYAVRVEGEEVATDDLEPYLETAGRYVGIAGLHREPWELSSAGGHAVWVRPEDNATALGTMIYTWASGDLVFLLIGVVDTVNRAIIEQLPGEPAPSPSPSPSIGASPSDSPEATAPDG
jgi:hypothetical protein